MPWDRKQLAREFNAAAPPPSAPLDDTVYENKESLLKLAGASTPAPRLQDPALPVWFDTMPDAQAWFRTLLQTELGRKIQQGFNSYGTLQTPLPKEIVTNLIRTQMNALHQSERRGDLHGYKIIDPLHPLEDIESPATQAFIDAQNERTRQFTAGSAAGEKTTAFLTEALRDRICKEFTQSADRMSCIGDHGRSDSWKYPVNDNRNELIYGPRQNDRAAGKMVARIGNTVIASRPISSKTSDQMLVSFPADAPMNVKVIAEGAPGNRLRGAFMHEDRLFVSFYHDCADELKVYTPEGQYLADVPLPVCKIHEVAVDEATGKLRLNLSTFLRPDGDYLYDVETNSLSPAEETPPVAALDDCIVEQIWARSVNSVRVPMWVVRHPDTALDGTAALKIWAYGASRIPSTPHYGASAAQWIRAGGIFVLANVRGGNELGDEWAAQGMGMNRANVVRDLAACANELYRRKYTAPERTVIEGGSNGGWLVLESVVKKAFPYGAAISHVPVSDLHRTHADGNAFPRRWDSKEFIERMKLSSLHNVRKNQSYTPTMILAGDSDVVANPWHAYKMAAALQASSSDNLCLLRVRRGTGHRFEFIPNDELIAEESAVQSFIEKCIGPVDQNEYKASPYYKASAQPVMIRPAPAAG